MKNDSVDNLSLLYVCKWSMLEDNIIKSGREKNKTNKI